MKYNPYYDQEQFQQYKYADQPTLRLLDWGLERLKQRQVQLGPDEFRAHLRQLLLAQVEADLVDLKAIMSVLQIDMTGEFKRYELAMDLGGLIELKATLVWPFHRRPGSPVFICLHGHQHEGRRWTVEEGPAAVLSQAGYACLCPDVIGLGENRGATENVMRGNITYDLLVHNALLLGWSLNWSRASYRQGKFERARQLADQALALAEGAPDAAAVSQPYNVLGILDRNQGELTQAIRHLTRGLEIAESAGDRGGQVAALNNLSLAYADSGELAQAISCTQKALGLCVSLGDRHRQAALHNNLADLYHMTGQREASLAHLKEAVVIFAEIGASGAEESRPEIWKLTEW